MERNTRDAELSETPQDTSGSLRVFYAPREDATAEGELSALANIYKFVLERHKEHKKDTGTESGGEYAWGSSSQERYPAAGHDE